jgi:Spy/CpxP family protein refolding chaperone
MKTRNAIIATILAVGLLAAVPLAYGGPGGRGMHRGHGDGFGAGMLFGHLRHVQEELDLSDQQVEQIKAIFAEVHEQNAQYREQLHGGLHGAMETLLADPNNLSAAQAALDQQAAAERAMKQNLLAAASKALNVLTPAQRSELAQMIQERSKRRTERRQNRR